MKLDQVRRAYFIGIGGIGMSALARYFNNRGVEVFGYDLTKTTLTKQLSKEGMQIHYIEDIKQIPDHLDLVVFTPAIPKTHKEFVYFQTEGIRLYKRSEVLGIISKGQKTIGVAGTHGKTTTTSLLTHVLKVGGVDCTAFLGGIAGNFESNYVEGSSDWVVVEADEYDRSFLQLYPEIAVILSMDADHLDIYGNAEEMENTYREYAGQVNTNGTLIPNQKILKKLNPKKEKKTIISYGVEAGDVCAKDIRIEDGAFVFDVESSMESIAKLRMTLPGKHNIENATAAIAVAQQLGVKGDAIRKALASFKGIKRRFEIVFKDNQRAYIDDYAHHPEELKAAINAAKILYKGKSLTGIFQPHLFSRTQDFVDGFAEALDLLDVCYLLPIYPARELPIEGVSSKMILDKMKNKHCQIFSKEEILDQLNLENIEVLITLGAGNIDTLVPKIKAKLEAL